MAPDPLKTCMPTCRAPIVPEMPNASAFLPPMCFNHTWRKGGSSWLVLHSGGHSDSAVTECGTVRILTMATVCQ